MEEATSKNYGYAKRPIWQWVALYLVVGAVIYGLIYYFVFANKGGYTYGTQNNKQIPNANVQVVPTDTSILTN